MKVNFNVDFSDKKTITVLTIIVICLILLCIYSRNKITTTKVLKNSGESDSKTNNEKKQNNKNTPQMIMYGRDSCPWCSKQKKELGDEMSNVKYINCEETPAMCKDAKISALPTWIINGKKHEGFMPKTKILELKSV
mgnify:CR=1 FL=1|tara:strand:- start:202 stop:612 length:411 start_codon:yes stop_codon:yes gene_type:complete